MNHEIERYAQIAMARKGITLEVARTEIKQLIEDSTSDFNMELKMRKYLEDSTHRGHIETGSKHGVAPIENHLHHKEG